MNAQMVIKVQILANQARKELAALNGQMAATTAATSGGASAARNFNNALNISALSKWGSQLQWAGRQLTYNFTMPLALAAGAATKWALDNERAWTRVQKVYGDSTDDPAALTAELKALDRTMELLSEKFGVQRAEVNQIAGDWAAAGAAGVALANGVGETLRVMVLGEMEAGEATQALIAIQAQYNMSTKDLTESVNALNVVENETGAQMPDLITAMSKAAGTARSAGVDVRHLAAMTAALVPASGTAANAGNGLKTIISRLLAPTKQATELMGLMGINTADVGWASLNAAQRLEVMAESFKDIDQAQKNVVSTYVAGRYQINRFDVLMRDIGSGNGYYAKALNASADANENAKVAFAELNAVLQSTPMTLQRMWVMMQNGLSTAIQPLLPVLVHVTTAVADLAKQFGAADPALQKMVITSILVIGALGLIATMLGAAGTAVAMLLRPLQVFGAIGSLLTGIWNLGFVVAIRNSISALGAFAASATAKAVFGGLMGGIGFLIQQFIALNSFILQQAAFMLWALGGQVLKGLTVFWGQLVIVWNTTMAGLMTGGLSLGPALMAGLRAGFAPVFAFAAAVPGYMATIRGAIAGIFSPIGVIVGRALAPIAAMFAPLTGAIFTLWSAVAAGVTTMFTTGFAGLAAYPSYLAPITTAMAGVWSGFMATLANISAAFATAWSKIVAFIPWATAAIGGAVSTAWAAIVNALGLISAWFATQWTIITTNLPVALATAGTAISTAWAAVMTFMKTAWATTQLFFTTTLPAFFARFSAVFTAIGTFWGGLMTAMGVSFSKLMVAIKGLAARLVPIIFGPWGIAIAAVVALIATFWDEIKDFFAQFQTGWQAQAGGIAKSFEPLVGFFNKITGWVVDAFYRMPEGVQNAVMAVVNIVKTAALKVYEWFGYMNPFKRHSPSLVESVTWGMAEVAKQYASIGNAGAPFKKAAADLRAFKLEAQRMNIDEWSDKRADVAEFMPSNLGNFNALVGHVKVFKNLLIEQGNAMNAQQAVVDSWQKKLDAANKVLDQQKDIADSLNNRLRDLTDQYNQHKDAAEAFASTALVGSKKYSDALFANEQAQKRLQLALLDMDASGAEDTQKKMASLRGEIEALQGIANDLHFAGAGSDVLGPINDQIKQMEAAYRDLGDTPVGNDSMSQMEEELKRLQKEAERLNLQESLELDPLRRQIEELANGTKELTFAEITAGINNERAAMAALQPAIDAATQAYNQQEAYVNQLEAARDALQTTYDAEAAKLQILKDEYGQTEDAIRDIERALNDVASAARQAGEAQKKAAGGGGSGVLSPAVQNFMDAEGGNFPEVGGTGVLGREGGLPEIEQFNEDLAAELGDMMGDFDMFGPIREKWDQFTAWWRATVVPAWNGLTSGLGNIFGSLDTSGFTEKFEAVKEKVEPVWNGIVGGFTTAWEIIKNLWGLVAPMFQNIWDNIVAAVGPAFDKIKEKIGPAWEAFKQAWASIMPFLAAAAGLITAAISGVLGAIGGIIGPLIDWIGSILAAIIQVATGIWNVISGVLDVVVGLVQGIIGVFKGIFTGDWSWFHDGFAKVWEGVKRVFQGVSEILGAIWSAIWRTIKGLIDVIVGAVSGFVNGIINWFTWLWDVLVGHSIVPDMVNAIIDWFKTLWTNVTTWVSDLVNGVIQWFQNLWDETVKKFNGLRDGIKAAWDAVVKWLNDGWTNIRDKTFEKIKEGAQWVQDKFESVKNGINAAWEAMKNLLKAGWEWVRDNVFNAFNLAVAAFGAGFDTAKGVINTAWEAMKTLLNSGWTWVRDNVFNLFNAAVTAVGSGFTAAKNTIKTAWDTMQTNVKGVWEYLRDNVFNKFTDGINAIGTTFGTVKDTIKTAWDKIKDAARDPVNFVIEKVYTNGIKSVWDSITSAVGLNLQLPKVDKIPAFANGTEDHRAQIARGGSMRLWAEPETGGEAYIPLAPHKRGASTRILRNVASRFGYGLTEFANGGFWENMKSSVSSAAGWVKDKALDVVSFLGDPVGAISDLISKPVEAIMKNIGGGKLGTALAELPRKTIERLIQKAKDFIGGGGGSTGGGVAGGAAVTIPTGGFVRPMIGGRVTSNFGPRWGAFHNGIDLAGGGRTYASWAGRVAKTGWNSGYGNTGLGILLDHANGLQTYYGHNPIGGIKVRPGQMVAAGQWIGHEGATGNVTGVHLHQSIFRNGRALNPRSYGVYDNGGILPPGGIAHNLSSSPEAVFSSSQWALLSGLLRSLTAQRSSDSIQRPATVNQTINFYGNLEFPNITNADDAKGFIDNITDYVGVG